MAPMDNYYSYIVLYFKTAIPHPYCFRAPWGKPTLPNKTGTPTLLYYQPGLEFHFGLCQLVLTRGERRYSSQQSLLFPLSQEDTDDTTLAMTFSCHIQEHATTCPEF